MNELLARLQATLEEAIRGMTVEDLARHPQGKWCAAEVLEHLSLTYSGSTRGFEKCLQAGHPIASPLTLKQRFGIILITRLGYFPTGREAPPTTRPRGALPLDVANGFGGTIQAMDKVIAECEARYGRSARLIDHPVLGPLTADEWRRFHWIHGKHHAKQLQALRSTVGRDGI